MKPTIGQMVLYKDVDYKWKVALVSDVNDGDKIELWMFGHNHIEFHSYVSQGKCVGQWKWMNQNPNESSE